MAFFQKYPEDYSVSGIKHVLLMALVPVIAVAGFLCMYMLNQFIPFTSSDLSAALYMLLLIAFGLGVPYVMVKLGVHEAAIISRQRDKDLELKDVAKDKEQLWGAANTAEPEIKP